MSKAAPTKDAVLEILKKIQGSLADVRNAQVDIRRDIRSMKDEIVSLRTIMGEFIKTDARRETDFLNLASRVDRIEQHLDLRDH
jgi:hypothetical protein